MKQLVFLLEELSAKALIQGLLPRLLGDTYAERVEVTYVLFEGKQDMEKRAARIVSCWQNPEARFLLLRDQDSGDCREVKERLFNSIDPKLAHKVVVRIACRELEAWVAGDWAGVAEAFGQPKVRGLAGKAKFRQPDNLGSPAREVRTALPAYQKVSGARAVGPLLDPLRNTSHSFGVFCKAVVSLANLD